MGAGNCLHEGTRSKRILSVPSLILSLVSDVYMTKTNGFKVSLWVEVRREKRPQEGRENPSGRYQFNPVEVSRGSERPLRLSHTVTRGHPLGKQTWAQMYKERKDDLREILLLSSPESHPLTSPRFLSEPQQMVKTKREAQDQGPRPQSG